MIFKAKHIIDLVVGLLVPGPVAVGDDLSVLVSGRVGDLFSPMYLLLSVGVCCARAFYYFYPPYHLHKEKKKKKKEVKNV